MATINTKWLDLAGEMLLCASEGFANHGCNDWEWPEGWSDEDRAEFFRAIHDANGSHKEEYRPGPYGPGDWFVMWFLGLKLKQLAATANPEV